MEDPTGPADVQLPESANPRRNLEDGLLRAISHNLQQTIAHSREHGKANPSWVVLKGILLTEHRYSASEPAPSRFDAPSPPPDTADVPPSSGLLRRIEEGQRRALPSNRPAHRFPRMTDKNAIQHWVVEADQVVEASVEEVNRINARVRSYIDLQGLEVLSRDRFYEFGFASFSVAPDPVEVCLECVAGPVYGSGDIYEVKYEANHVQLEHMVMQWQT